MSRHNKIDAMSQFHKQCHFFIIEIEYENNTYTNHFTNNV